VVRDIEFVQFHPTVLWLGGAAFGQQPLISEAVRGEGGFLIDDSGTRFMSGQHELADLAPRDVVAKAIMRRTQETGADHVWLDARHFGAEKWRVRFPTILASLNSLGIDPVTDLIPVAPACHYASGGIATDYFGRSSVAGLYACGEAACTGVHGANRLASNSLLEGLVFGRRIADELRATLTPDTPLAELGVDVRSMGIASSAIRAPLQREMSAGAGVIRDADGLARVSAALQKLAAQVSRDPRTESWESTNVLTVASALVAAAMRRQETRGSHWREDHPDSDDVNWLGHLDLRLGPDGMIRSDFQAIQQGSQGTSGGTSDMTAVTR
jgi:L-aspartate oxidase